MILNFLSGAALNISYFFVINLAFFFSFKNTQSLFTNDLCARLFLDDFYVNLYYFMWTHLWYIPIFFTYIVYGLLTYKVSYHSNPRVLSFINFFILVLFYELEYFNMNANYPSFTYNPNNLNFLLLNSLNKYHPFLLYTSLTLFAFIAMLFYRFDTMFSLHYAKVTSTIVNINKNLVVVSLSALVLGSWWALQEGSWGGWWNWDISEIFGLYIFFRLLILAHWPPLQHNSYFLLSFLLTSVTVLTIFYFLMQVNFNLISHNFGFRSNYFFTKFNYIFILILVTKVFKYFKEKYYTISIQLLKLRTYYLSAVFSTKLLRYANVTLFNLVILKSILILVINFIWLNFYVNLVNLNFNYTLLLFYIVLALYVNLFYLDIKYLVAYTFALNKYFLFFIFYFLFFFVGTSPLLIYLHFIIVLGLLYVNFTITHFFLYWKYMHITLSYNFILKFFIFIYTVNYAINEPLLELNFTGNSYGTYDYNFYTTVFNSKLFLNLTSNYTYAQQFLPMSYLPKFTSLFFDKTLNIVTLLLVLWYSIWTYYTYYNYILEK